MSSLVGRFIGLDDSQKLDLGLAYHAGLFRIERGIGEDGDWRLGNAGHVHPARHALRLEGQWCK